MISMLLKNLIKNIPTNKRNITISGLTTSSFIVKKNYIFFAIKGKKKNGENFISEAIKKGATVIVCSKNCSFKAKDVLVIKIKDIRGFLSLVASKFYKLKPKNIIAVTGTNGKTSVADLFFQILKNNNIHAASIGTLGVKYNNKIIKTNLTSPDTIMLHKHLSHLKKKKIDNVIIEASSHGLDQKRLSHINFKAGIFTNFSQDHLDYHKTMKSYLNAKLILFREILKKGSVIISDRKIRQYKILNQIAKKKKVKIKDISNDVDKIQNYFYLNNNYKINNLAMAIQATRICGLKDKLIYKTIKKLKNINGRLELVRTFQNNVKVFVDYAHTPDALHNTLNSLKNDFGNNISLVFGCGGDRDKKKRAVMAKIANDNCEKIYITDDNPRNENPAKIRNEISKHISKRKFLKIGNRALAIKKAIFHSNPNEIILIAGKGHEEYQIYKNKIINISDKKIVNKIKKKKVISKKKMNFDFNRSLLKEVLGKIKPVNFDGLSIDTRTIKKDNLFLAIKGKKNDGNKFIKKALRKGAGCVITSVVSKKYNKKLINIKNTISFLNHFAKLKRKYTTAKIIAITGSAGKTSLKTLVNDLLINYDQTYSSPKSFNNHLGVPISLSNLSLNDKFGIFEVGMSKQGEIRSLTKLIKPNIGVITNIGEAHLENFKNIYGIAKAKSEIIENIQPGGTIILNRDDKFFSLLLKISKKHNLNILSFGRHKESDIRLKKIVSINNTSKAKIVIDKKIFVLKINDLNIYNVLASIAVLKGLKTSLLGIENRFDNFESPQGRGKKYSISRYNKKFKLIDESYNASPMSVKLAIQKLGLIKKDKFKKYLILGDMLELGSKSKKYHEDLSKVINNSDIDKVFIKGKKTIFTYKHLNKNKRGNILQNNEDLDLSLQKFISNNDYLMIKGSNATGLHNFSKKLIKGI